MICTKDVIAGTTEKGSQAAYMKILNDENYYSPEKSKENFNNKFLKIVLYNYNHKLYQLQKCNHMETKKISPASLKIPSKICPL